MSEPREKAEALAALIDGTLDPKIRVELLADLDASPDNLAVVADALAIRSEFGVANPETQRRLILHRPILWLSIAATVLIVAFTFLHRATMPSLPAGTSVSTRLATADVAGTSVESPWSAQRGAVINAQPTALAVRVGARIVDLDLLMRVRDPRASIVALEISSLLATAPAGGYARAAFDSVASSRDASRLQVAADLAEGILGRNAARVGSSLRALEVASMAGDSVFLTTVSRPTLAKSLREIVGSDSTALALVTELDRGLGKTTSGYAQVRQAASQLLRQLGQ